MNNKLSRRTFIKSLGAATLGVGFTPKLIAQLNEEKGIKTIEGSWFEFQHHNLMEGKYWNHTLANFTAEEWDKKIKEISRAGLRYLVLLNTAISNKTFYPSKLLTKHQLNCEDPLEIVLSAADKYNVKFFVSNGFYGEWTKPVFLMQDKNVENLRLQAMNEIAEKYAIIRVLWLVLSNETGFKVIMTICINM